MGHYVYKYVLHGEVLYIGKSDQDNVYKRLQQHGHPGDNIPEEAWPEISAAKVYYTELANSVMSDVVESELIRRYHPKYNDAKTTTDWQGLDFPEPIWIDAQFDGVQKLNKKVIRLQDALDSAMGKINELTDEIQTLRLRNMTSDHLIDNYEKDKRDYCKNCNLHSEINKLQDYFDGFKKQEYDVKLDSGKTIEEIIDEYKTTTNPLAYKSEAFDKYGNLLCLKTIYTNAYGFLEFDFQQNKTTSTHGTLFVSRDDTTMKYFQVIRLWKNRGNNIYYPYKLFV